MHTLDVVFKQSSPPRLPQYKHTHTCMQNQKHSNTSCSYLACKAKYFLVCLKDSQFMSWLGICIVVRLADKSSKSGQGGKNVKKKKKDQGTEAHWNVTCQWIQIKERSRKSLKDLDKTPNYAINRLYPKIAISCLWMRKKIRVKGKYE